MTFSQIMALVMDVLVVVALIYLIVGKSELCRSKFRKYLIAVTGVYFSGTLLVTVIVFISRSIPIQFTIISEFSMLFMFVASFYTVLRLANNLDAIKDEINGNKE